MPVDLSNESESDDDVPKTQNVKRSQNNKAPSLSDTEAFPETLGGGAPTEAASVPNFAGLAANFQSPGPALNKPAQIARKPITRLPRVRDIYKARDVASKPLSNTWTMYCDAGIQGSEKNAECESQSCGSVATMKEFFPVWAKCASTVLPGSNIRMFKTDLHTSPSPLDTQLDQGGKWSIPVSKAISRDMFEELALYMLDERLGETVVGTVFAIRDEVDLLQIWLKQSPSPETVANITADITSLMGLPDDVSPPNFVAHQSAFKKANKVKKYFLVEPSPRGLPFDSQAQALKPRSRIDTSERKANKKAKKQAKKGDEGFINVQHSRKPSKGESKSASDKKHESAGVDASTSNPFDGIDFGNDDDHKSKADKENDNLVFKERKKTQKPNSRRGSSKKDKKSSGGDEYDWHQPQRSAVIPLPVFMAAGGAIILLLAMAAYTYTSGTTQ
jgi:hypothetical protein